MKYKIVFELDKERGIHHIESAPMDIERTYNTILELKQKDNCRYYEIFKVRKQQKTRINETKFMEDYRVFEKFS